MKNVILITIDECKDSAMSPYGNMYVQTPAAEYMQKHGITFSNAFTVHSKCVPSRSALLSGMYPHTGGHRTLPGFELRKDEDSLISELKEGGYITAMFGKNHSIEETLVHEFFDYTSVPFHGNQNTATDQSNSMNLEDPMCRAFYRGVIPHSKTYRPDSTYVDESIQFLTKHKNDTFFLLVNLEYPHPPYVGIEPYFSEIQKRIEAPPACEDLASAPWCLQKYRETYGVESLTADQRIEIEAAYLSMVSYVDNQVMRILDILERLKLMEDSIVVYTSDHGDFAGEHGAYEKFDTLFYDSLIKIPLYIMSSDLPKDIELSGFVENIDMYPTIRALLDLPAKDRLHGMSLHKYMKGISEHTKSEVFCQGGVESWVVDKAPHQDDPLCERMKPNYYLKQKVIKDNPATLYRAKMVRDEQWKLVYRVNGFHELYQMQHDPHEHTNLFGQFPEVERKLIEKLLLWEIQTETTEPKISELFA